MTSGLNIKIITVYPYPKRGGCFRQVCAAIEGIASAGGEVHYLSAKPFPVKHGKRIMFHRFPFHSDSEMLFYPLFYLLSPIFLFYVVRKHNIRKALVFNEEFAAIFFLAKIYPGIKILLHIQGDMASLIRSKKMNPLAAFFLRLYGKAGILISDRVWAVSCDLIKRIGRYYGIQKQISCLYNAVPKNGLLLAECRNLRERYRIGDGKFIIGFIGSLIPRKNAAYLVEEFGRVPSGDKTLLIVGGGPDKADLCALGSSVCGKDAIVFAGEPEDYLDIAKSLDILVLPTLHDDCPRIILECLGLGTPVIASNTGGIPEILKYDELMFNPLEKGALEKKLERMIKDPSYLAEIKKLCSERKPFFDKDWGEEIVRLVKEN